MKSILVPTDFSECAGFALDAAVRFAQKFGARVHLFAHLQLPDNWNEMTPEARLDHPAVLGETKQIESRFQEIVRKYPDLEITTFYGNGNMAKSISKYVQSHGIELIIMGSHGISGKSEYFIGSNTQRVIRSVHCPVLVLKNPLPNISFDKVVYASGFNENEREVFLRFKELVKPFLPEIHLLAIHTHSLFDPPYTISKMALEEFKKLCAPFHCEAYIYTDLNIDRGIRGFAEDIGADLIGMSNHYRHPLKRMLSGSNVEALVNHAEIPVLSVDYDAEEEPAADSGN